MTKFKAKGNGWLYKKGDILELIQKEADGCSLYRLKDGTETYACDANLFEVYQPKFKSGDTARITQQLYGHGFKIGEVVKVKRVGVRDYLVTNTIDSWYVTDAEIEEVILDKQGYPLTIGDKVMICAAMPSKYQGERASIVSIHGVGVRIKFEDGRIWGVAPSQVLRLAKNGLPYNVDLYIRTNSVITGRLWSAQHTEIIRMRRAACSPTDEFSWETGIYGVLIPRLFNCPIRVGV